MLKKQYLKSKPVCKVTFSLPKEAVENASEIKVLGDFNNWNWEEGATMKAKKAAFETTLELEAGRSYEFRYLIDQAVWENDHAADEYIPSPYYGIDNSVVVLDTVTISQPAKKKAAPRKAAPKKATAVKATKATTTTKDNLKKIEGIGPKIEKLFNEAGISTFAALAKAKKTTLKNVLDAAGPRFKMHDPTTWTEQAKLAAKGDWEKLEILQKELKGGKRK